MKAARDRRASRWDAHRAARRAQLVDAAIVAIRRHGAGVGMDDVAAQAGTSKTVVYRHFTDRTDLYVAVCGRVAEILLAQVRAAMASTTDGRAMVAAGIDAYLRLIESDPEVYRFVVHRPMLGRDPGTDPVLDLVAHVGEEAAGVIRAHLARSGGDPAAAEPWGHAVVGLVQAAADRWLARPGGMTRTELTAHLTHLTWSGLAGVLPPPPEAHR